MLFLCALLIFVADAYAASFLQATKFSKTTSDLDFSKRLDIKADGYEPFAGLSPYQALKFVEMEEAAHDAIKEELTKAGIDQCPDCDKNGNMHPGTDDGEIQIPTQPITPQPISNKNETNHMRQGAGGYCSLRHPQIPTGQKIPLGQPVNMQDMPISNAFTDSRTTNIMRNTLNGAMCSPYGYREKIGAPNVTRPHTGVDIGCTEDFYRMPVYTPADGVVTLVTRVAPGKSAGNYIRIEHADGWTTQYMHLDEMLVTKGQQVSAGCLIGYMGYTGGNADQKNPSMGKDLTHLHYEILYSGRKSQLTAPNGKKIPIVRGRACNNGKGFETKIKPNDLMTYYDK